LLQFVVHILRQFLSVVLANPAVFGCRKETPEVEGFLADFCDREVSSFENSLQSLEQSFGLVTALLDVLLQRVKLP